MTDPIRTALITLDDAIKVIRGKGDLPFTLGELEWVRAALATLDRERAESSLDVSPELRALSAAATPGPWVDQMPGDNDPGAGTVWIDTHAYEAGPEPVVAPSYPLSQADAALIVAAVNDLRSRLSTAAHR